jgi:hypothetical protein
MEYLTKPPRFLPIGKVLVHNHVKPRLGSRRFRAWLDRQDEKYEVCTCGYGPHLVHHRVKLRSAKSLEPARRTV